jgi:hypothetical protein
MLEMVNLHLESRGIKITTGTIVASTIYSELSRKPADKLTSPRLSDWY